VTLLFYLEILQLGIAGLCDLALWAKEIPQLLVQLLLLVRVGGQVIQQESTLSQDNVKGTVSRDFLLQVFFMNHLPPSP
jgi:hypothetical protein